LKQNFSKQVFGYLMAAKSDKEKDLQKRILFRKDATPIFLPISFFYDDSATLWLRILHDPARDQIWVII
jgi:hypothetical protein